MSAETPALPALRSIAELLGGLLLREVTARDLEYLRDPHIAAALAEFGAELPGAEDENAWLEERAADYHDCFLRPEAGPLVQSLWTEGRYEGDAAVRLRQLAEAANLEFDRTNARGAPIDHLGAILLLWSTCEHAPVADDIVRHHLHWADRALAPIQERAGFYGAIARATRSWLTLELMSQAVPGEVQPGA